MVTWWEKRKELPRLTDEQALEFMIELWDCLAQHPGWVKLEFFRQRGLDPMLNSCPLCEHVNERHTPFSCRYCLLYGKWAKGQPESDCTYLGSPYRTWSQTLDPSESSISAKAVANLARVALAELRAVKPKLKCPWCGSNDVKRVDEETVECNECKHRTDLYESMKQAERR